MPTRSSAPKVAPSGRVASKSGLPWVGIAVVLLLTLLGGFAWWASTPIALRSSPVEVHIPAGSGLRVALRLLDTAGAPSPTWPMIALARLTGVESTIKAGSYELHDPLTPKELLDKLTRGDVSQAEVVLPEGWTFRQMRARLDAHPDLRHEAAGLSDAALLKRIGAVETQPEGLFFPDTYLFDKRSADTDLYARAYRAMQRRLNESWAARAPDSPLQSPYQALVLASIVEKETGRGEDRPLIAAVFSNRLRRNMPLQTDPTVIYGIGERFDGNLRKRDLLADGTYNTYTRTGLPPTPIAMPGHAALAATLNPAPSRALYFVARGDGTSHFSMSLAEHERAVTKYQRQGSARP